MNQYILKYKPNGAILGWYCTKEAAWDRMNYLTDTNFFGVFEVEVSTNYGFPDSVFVYMGTVLKSNNAVLNVARCIGEMSLSSDILIKQGIAEVKPVQFRIIGKELKQPKPEKDEDF